MMKNSVLWYNENVGLYGLCFVYKVDGSFWFYDYLIVFLIGDVCMVNIFLFIKSLFKVRFKG